MTRAQIRRICAEGAKYFIEDPYLHYRGVCIYLEWNRNSALSDIFRRYMAPPFGAPRFRSLFWLKEPAEYREDHTCRNRRAMALLLFAEVVDLKELK